MSQIDYQYNDLHSQIVSVVGESFMNDVLEIVIRFVIGMIEVERNDDCSGVSVEILHEAPSVSLIFRYRCQKYYPILNARRKAYDIYHFFSCYFDDIHYEYRDGENKLILVFTLMPDAEMEKKYFKALDKKLQHRK